MSLYDLEETAVTVKRNRALVEQMGSDPRLVELWRRLEWAAVDAHEQHEAIRRLQHQMAEEATGELFPT